MFCKIYRDFIAYQEISEKKKLQKFFVKRAGEKISVKSKTLKSPYYVCQI